MSPQIRRFWTLVNEMGLSTDEAYHAVGRRDTGWDKLSHLSRREQELKADEYIGLGLERLEAERIVGIGDYKAPKSPKKTAGPHKSLDWMPAVKLYHKLANLRGRRGLLK